MRLVPILDVGSKILVSTLAAVLLLVAVVQAAPCDLKPSPPPFVRHDLSNSYCELCGIGYVTVIITNPYSYTDVVGPGDDEPGAIMTNMELTVNLGSSGLVFADSIAQPLSYQINGGPTVYSSYSPGSGTSTLTFDSSFFSGPLAELESNPSATSVNTITIRIAVTRETTPEGLVSANRTISSTLSFDTVDSDGTPLNCGDSPDSDSDTLPLHEPLPQVVKTGWNYDAGQRLGSASDPVYGTNNDDIVWRVRFDNSGLAGLQDLRFDDLMEAGSVVISHVCATDTAANTIAANNGVGTATGCVGAGNTIGNFIVTDPFGDMAVSFDGHEVDVTAGGTASVYLVGKITADGSCETHKTNTVSDVQWGCEVQTPAGGIAYTSSGQSASDAATFYSLYGEVSPALTVNRQLTGINTSQPVGTKGTMTITLRNNTGGSVKNIELADVLPVEYVVDSTYPPTLDVTPAYGNSYTGLIDTLTWTNPAAPGDPLANTAPEFTLTSSTASGDYVNMLRHGDVAEITFRVVLIESDYYDRAANLDVNPEEYPVTATDPTYQASLSNQLTVDYDLFCPAQSPVTLTLTGNGTGNPTGSAIPAFPEDLDVDISEDIFILTNDPNQLLTLPIEVTNNGGHDAADYHLFVSFGTTMDVVNAPGGCSPISTSGTPVQPDPWKVWTDPTDLPATAAVYECTSPATISPGQTVTYAFDVRKTSDLARIAEDDLSLRADVVGEITLSSGDYLTFPTPIVRPDGELDRANNYSLDATWARVIGFNLIKTQQGECNENAPPSYDSDGFEEVQIGEECAYQIDTGGWFGFETPGFIYIAVQNIDVEDQVPDGQAYISSTDPADESSALIQGVSLYPAGLTALTEGPFGWIFNVPDSQRIEVADVWFVVDTTTRLLNKPIDERNSPNLHAANSHNVLVSTFDATFSNVNTGLIEQYTLGPSTVGYPNEAIRRVDLTVTEPYLTLVKEVCNESLYGSGPTCSNFVPIADDGDAYDKYIYRITVSNEQTADGVQRAPAYDVTVTDRLDASDLAYVEPFAGDGLDNDGDGSEGGADANGEGSISENVVESGTPAILSFSYTHSSALQRIDPGASVSLYYRVDFDDKAAPLQTFSNEVSATYDSLTGPSGNQSSPTGANSELGGARFYTSDPASASVRIIPVATLPKAVTAVANTPLAASGTQEATIGEELEYELHVLLPVAQVRNFIIQDALPEGLRCSEAPAVNLDAAPYNAAGFVPGGTITPVCGEDTVSWDFGDQRLTIGSSGTRYDLAVGFIAQVENSAQTNEGDTLTNGAPSTSVSAEYIDESGATVTYDIGEVAIDLHEPLIGLTTSFAVAEADADDLVTVTVSATNNGTVPAYNLMVLDDLDATRFSYAGSVGGSDPPDVVDLTTLGMNQPIFSWNPPNGIAVGATLSFTYQVQLATDVEVQEVLDNTVQATWTSLPDQATALNSGGAIGIDGAADGMRNGTLPNSGDPVNDYETEAGAQLTVAAPELFKTDQNAATVPTIGAHKLFRIEFVLPEGISNNVLINDQLDYAGLSYVLADNSDFSISYSFAGIASINGQAPPTAAAFNAVPVDGSSGTVTWDIGTVVTETEDDSSASAINPTIRIDYYARVNNDLDTDAGDLLRNRAEAAYLNAGTAATENLEALVGAVTVSEPDLILLKTVANVTTGKNVTDPPMAGDTLEYRLALSNVGSTNSTAYDINIVDTLPDGVALDSGFTPTATIDGSAVSGFVAMPTGGPTGTVIWGRENADDSLDLAYGQALTIIYRTTVLVVSNPGGLIENAVYGDWTSLQQASVYERTGTGCPSITLPDDYCVGPISATVYGIAPELDFQKIAVDVATGSTIVTTASPGDTLRYQLLVNNISTAQAQFSLSDELDRLNSSPWFVPGTLVLLSGPAEVGIDANGGTDGTGLLSSSNIVLDGGDSLIVDFTAQLIDVIPGGTQVLNQGQLELTGFGLSGSDDPNIAGEFDPTPVTIDSAPQWQFEKTSDDLTGASTVLLPGDQLRYTILVRNIGTEDAVNVVLSDAIPANTSYVGGSTTLNGTAVADPMPGVSPLENGMPINAAGSATAGEIPADAAAGSDSLATVTFIVQVDAAAASGTIISNQAALNGSGDGSGAFAEQLSDDPETAAANDPTIDVVSGMDFVKSVDNVTTGGSGATASPGDILRYTLSLTNTSTVVLTDVTIRDELESLQPSLPQLFAADTLTLESYPATAAVAGTSATGGTKGTGLVVVSGFDVAAGATVDIVFTVQLAEAITNGTEVLNQAELLVEDTVLQLTDSTDVSLPGDEDPTVTLIGSSPAFVVEKTAAFLDGDTSVLLAGERLRYTITVKNVGTEDAVSAVLQDYIPAHTTYVANSTRLNGSAVGDVGGESPLQTGLAIHSPDTATSGYLTANSDAAANNVATITFVVRVDADAMDGLVIENQAFLNASGAGSGVQPEQPSDDPSTPTVDDPTRVVVGNVPLLYALKTVALAVDNNGNGLVNPGDILEYSITLSNSGAAAATSVVLTDAVPANLTYVADSLQLNSVANGPDGGVFPLAGGLSVQSSDNPGSGTISIGESAVVTYRMQVNAAVPTGTLISNQGTVSSAELVPFLTDADGVPANGYQPTVVVVGDVQLLTIAKTVSIVDGATAEPGSELIYTIQVTNISGLPASDVMVTDDLNPPLGDQIAYLAGSGTLNGSTAGVSFAGNILSVDYASTYGDLAPGASLTVRFRVQIDPALAYGTTITNVGVVTWDSATQNASDDVSLDVGGTPGSSALNGRIWHDVDLDSLYTDGGDPPQQGWTVRLYLSGSLVYSTLSDENGNYRLAGLVPSDSLGALYEIRFLAPGAGVATPSLGYAVSFFTDGPQRISDISVAEGGNLQDLNLPLQPNGTIYNSVAREAIGGAGLTMINAATGNALPDSCFDDPAQQDQVTAQNGFYKFDLNFSNAACPPGGSYLLAVDTPTSGYLATPSLIIPPSSDSGTVAFSVPACPGSGVDAIPTTTDYCEAVPSPAAPPLSVAAGTSGTNYYLHLALADGTVPVESQIYNNPIPIDPELDSAVAITKTAALTSVTKGELIPYTITVTNIYGVPLEDVSVVDRFPAGFKYVAGSARLDGNAVEPEIEGRVLTWDELTLDVNQALVVKLLLVVGSGVGEGEYVNRAQVYNTVLGRAASGEASATVRVIPDPDFDCSDVLGKVFDDRNLNGYQDSGEIGLSGVRLVTARGLIVTTDEHGRYHITCAVVPDEDRGSNFILKLDDRSLPTGYRVITENPRVQRATRGKALRMNFGASLHRVVAIDIADGAFEPETSQLRIQWRSKIDQLLEVLKEAPSILRLSYLADIESEDLANQRLKDLRRDIAERWKTSGSGYRLTVETEVFWRRGRPPQR